MRSTLLALLAPAALVSANLCFQDNINELTARSTCGNSKEISKCLYATADLRRVDEIEQCFVAGGCEPGEATAEAVWFSIDCQAWKVEEAQEELKRRAESSATETSATTAEKTTETSATTEATTEKTSATAKTTETTTTSPSTTEATTTSDSTTSTTDASTAAASTTSTTSSTSTDSTTTSGTTTTPLVCSTTNTVSTSFCPTNSAGSTLSCYATTTLVASCAPGLLCQTTTAGADICMKIDNSLTTSGLIVTIVFAVGISSAIIAFVAVGLHGRSKSKKAEQAALLAKASSGRGKDVEANPFASNADLPLIPPGGQRSETYYNQEEYYNEGSAPASNAPKLHQGLGALGQEPRY